MATVSITKTGYDISPASREVTVSSSNPTPVAFNGLSADGTAGSVTTTKLTLSFDQDITGLTADDISLSPGTLTKGDLTRTGTGVYELGISGIAGPTFITLGVTKPGYSVGPASRDIMAHYGTVIMAGFSSLIADGSAAAATTKLTLTFNQDIAGLTADDLTLSPDTLITKGSLIKTAGTGNYELGISVNVSATMATVGVTKAGYLFDYTSRTVQSWGSQADLMVTVPGKLIIGTYASGYYSVFLTGRKVSLSGFRMAKYETTWNLWDAVVREGIAKNKGYTFKDGAGYQGHQVVSASGTASATGTSQSAYWTEAERRQRPVSFVTWYDCIVWCNLYSELAGLDPVYRTQASGGAVIKDASVMDVDTDVYMDRTNNGYRLPTEAEWEFAAKGGDPDDTTNWNYTYAGSNSADEVGWHSVNAGGLLGSTAHKNFGVHPVGTLKANKLGLYDMGGNVGEWCWDWYGASNFGDILNADGAVVDPSGGLPQGSLGPYRMMHGGAYSSSVTYMEINNYRTTSAAMAQPGNPARITGFRLVLPW
jgi:formylglycine-generating enzyme required for sulfatase activity